MRKNKLLVAIFTFVLAFSAAFFSACDLLPENPSDNKGPSGVETGKPEDNRGHIDFLIEDFNQRWNNILILDSENSPKKVTNEHQSTFSSLMAELRAIDWKEPSKDENGEQTESQEKLNDLERRFYSFLNETERLVRGGFYVTFEIIPYKIEDEKPGQDSVVENPENNKIVYPKIEHWSKNPVTYQEIVDEFYGKNTIEGTTYWDRYVPKLNGAVIGANYTFSQSVEVVCYENDPDFYITVEETNLDNQTNTWIRDCWGEFTFWQWMRNGCSMDNPTEWHEYYRSMGQRPITCNGQLMQPTDVINSSCTFVMIEQEPLYDINIVLEINGERRDIGESHLFYSHSLLLAAIWDTTLYESNYIDEGQIYYYLDWFDIYFNGQIIPNNEIKEYTIEQSGTITLKGRNRYEVLFEIDVYNNQGEYRHYGPYTVVCETHELYAPAKAGIHLEEFLREQLGHEEYDEVFSGLVFYLDEYTTDMIEHSCKLVAKPYQSNNNGNDESNQPSDEEWRKIIEEEVKNLRFEWEEFGKYMDVELFDAHFEKIIMNVYGATSWEDFDVIRSKAELLRESVHLYHEIMNDWEQHVLPTYSPDGGRVEEFRQLVSDVIDSGLNSREEVERLRQRYQELREEVIKNHHSSQDKPEDKPEDKPTEPETPTQPTIPEGFPTSVMIYNGTLIDYRTKEYLGHLNGSGEIVNQETLEKVGYYLVVINENGEYELDEKGRMTYLITLTMGEISYTYTVKAH